MIKYIIKTAILDTIILLFVCIIVFYFFKPFAITNYYDNSIEIYNKELEEYKALKLEYDANFNYECSVVKNEIISNQNKAGYGEFLVTINSECDYNNSVGDDWYFEYYINGIKISSNDIIRCPIKSNSNFRIICIEYDNVPDISDNSFSYHVLSDNGFSISLVTKENRGRYSGNSAQHTFYFWFERYFDEDIVKNTAQSRMSDPPIEPTKPNLEDVNLTFLETLRYNVLIPIIWLVFFIIFITKIKIRLNILKDLNGN